MIFIDNVAKCSQCSKNVHYEEDFVVYPDIIYNEGSCLYLFSGTLSHRHCFDRLKCNEEALEVLMMYNTALEDKKCIIDGDSLEIGEVGHPDNIVFLGYFSDDPSDYFYKYNLKYLNKVTFKSWNHSDEFMKELNSRAKVEKWQRLNYLVKILESPIHKPVSRKAYEMYMKHKK